MKEKEMCKISKRLRGERTKERKINLGREEERGEGWNT